MHGWQKGEVYCSTHRHIITYYMPMVLPKLATNPHVASKQASRLSTEMRWYNNIIVLLVPPAAPTKNDDSD